MGSNFAFILNPLTIEGPSPFELVADHWLDRPTLEELEIIRKFLERFGGIVPADVLYEFEPSSEPGSQSRITQPERWKHAVIRFAGSNVTMSDLQVALHLLEPSLEVGFTAMENSTVFPSPLNLATFFDFWGTAVSPSITITEDVIRQIQQLYLKTVDLQTKLPDVYRAVQNLSVISSLSRRSEMFTLSHFTIIESLLTHQSRTDHDSLTHQICTKMLLLGKRFSPPLDYQCFPEFKSQPEKVWKTLYCLRSAIAHGMSLDFKGKHKHLKSHCTAQKFLSTTVRRLICFSLQDYNLVADLKAC